MILTERRDGVSLTVKVKAGSKRDRLLLMPEWLRVEVKAPPVEGRANAAVCGLIEGAFSCKVELLRGEHDSRKILLLKSISIDAAQAALNRLALQS